MSELNRSALLQGKNRALSTLWPMAGRGKTQSFHGMDVVNHRLRWRVPFVFKSHGSMQLGQVYLRINLE
jgi:hypothetical protein